MDSKLDRAAIEALMYDPDSPLVEFMDQTQNAAIEDLLATVPRKTGALAASVRKDRDITADGKTPRWLVLWKAWPGNFSFANRNLPWGTWNPFHHGYRELHDVPEGGARHALDAVVSIWDS